MPIRSATHAGSWYSADKRKLALELDRWLDEVPTTIPCIRTGRSTEDGAASAGAGASAESEESRELKVPGAGITKDVPIAGARAIIAPHAGHAYSGPAATWAYKTLDFSKAKRIFLLGPSHHAYLPGCALTRCEAYETPFGSLSVDVETIAQLHETKAFEKMSLPVDEAEHSLELHLPHIYRMLQRTFESPSSFPSLIPILVGATDEATERRFGKILAPYLSDPSSVFIISSDFCHWGGRFRYTYYKPAGESGMPPQRSLRNHASAGSGKSDIAAAMRQRPIYESIAAVDGRCMDAIESGVHATFLQVLEETGNTVCGRHPIGVIMAALEEIGKVMDPDVGAGRDEGEAKLRFMFVRYERSSDVTVTNTYLYDLCEEHGVTIPFLHVAERPVGGYLDQS